MENHKKRLDNFFTDKTHEDYPRILTSYVKLEKRFKPTKKNSSFFGPTVSVDNTNLEVVDEVVADVPYTSRSQDDANLSCRAENTIMVDLNDYKSPIRRNLKGYLNFYRSTTEKENSSGEEKIDHSDNKKFFSDEKYDAFLEEFFDKERDGNDEFQLLEILNEKLVSLGFHVDFTEWLKLHQDHLNTLLGDLESYQNLKYMELFTEEDIQGSHEATRENMRKSNEYAKKYNEDIDKEHETQIKSFEKDRQSLDAILSTIDELQYNARSYIQHLMQQSEIEEDLSL
jgi:hypothetical protein